tara:strand:+ start:9851 stop:10786 length:936 start_codon:yes stop_codon:yes gene_type:complete
MKKSKILIVGSNGFLGSTVLKKMNENKNFIVSHIGGKENLDVKNLKPLISFFDEKKFDYVINCSAFVGGISFGYEYPVELLEINTTLANNLYRASYETNVKLLVNPISNCAYPSNINYYEEDKFWEGPPHESVFNYGLSKRFFVGLGDSYNEQYNFSSANVVLSNMYGPNDHFDESRSHALGALVKKICDAKINNQKNVEVWGTGKPIREWLYVEDGADSLIKSLELSNDHFFFNVGIGKGISIKELAEKIAQYAKWEGELTYNTDKPDGVMEKTVNGNKGEKLLGWKPPTSLDIGIKLTVDWYLEYGTKK